MGSIKALDLTGCEREPIHAPGAIQPFGGFLAAEFNQFTITHASANIGAVLGRGPHEVIGLSLERVLGPGAAAAAAAAGGGVLHRAAPRECEICPPGGARLRLHGFAAGGLLGIDLEPLGGAPAMPIFPLQALAEDFKYAATADELCDMAVRGLRALTGYDRVVAYRFHEDGHGEVIAEARAPEAEAFFGLRYPASDVPPQAHALYLRKLVGVTADTEAVPAAVIAGRDWRGQALDLTDSDLRAVSPRHLQYMRNMNTAAALRIGLPDGERLWGLLVCHHLTPRLPCRAQRAAAALIGQIAALKLCNLDAAESSAQQASRQALLDTIVERLAAPRRFLDVLPDIETELLALVGAAGALVHHNNTTILIGKTPPEPACLRMLASLRSGVSGQLSVHNDLSLHQPAFADCAAAASGALLLPLATDANTILWFRPEHVRTVTWGGNPVEHAMVDEATGEICPRRSFAAWQETMRGRSLPWTELDIELAKEFRNAFAAGAARYMKTQLVRLRDYDAVTGLPNWARLQQWLGEPGRHNAARIGLLAIDLGDLRDLTGLLGAEGVSVLLVELAQRLLPIAGEDSLAARHGEAEFIVLFLGLGPAELKARTLTVCHAIEEAYLIRGRSIRITPTYRCTYADEAEGRDLGGAAGHAIAAAKAASAFKRQVDTQRQKMEGLGRMMGGIAHEINNMLQPVTLLGQDLLDRNLMGSETSETLGIMLDCTRQACHIISDVLAFSRRKGRVMERFKSSQLLRDKIRLVRQAIPSGVILVVDIQDDLPDILTSRTTFAQILVNLATNAAAAMAGEGTLTITLTGAAEGGQDGVIGGAPPFILLLVTDTGCGMDQETMDRAFEPFFTTKPVGVGTGLGLPVVFGLVEEMSGTITLASAPGAGTTVSILIPCAGAAGDVDEEAAQAAGG